MHTHPINDPFTWSSLVYAHPPFNDPFTWEFSLVNDPFTVNAHPPI